MRIYELPNDYYKLKIKEKERGIAIVIPLLGLLFVLALYSFDVLSNWLYLLVALPLIWLCVEGWVLLMRRRKVKKWFEYSIGYEKELIRELSSGVVKNEILRDDVVEAYEEFGELILITKHGERVTIPNEIEGYDDLRVRLLNWNKVKKTYPQVISSEIKLKDGPKFEIMGIPVEPTRVKKPKRDREFYEAKVWHEERKKELQLERKAKFRRVLDFFSRRD